MSFARTVHLLVSYWGLVLMSFHIGVHGGVRSKAVNRKSSSTARIFALRAIAALLALWGVSAFIRREIGSNLFLQNQFVFYDFSQPLACFLADIIAVVVLFAMVGYYTPSFFSASTWLWSFHFTRWPPVILVVYFVARFGPFCGEDWYPFRGAFWRTLSYHLHFFSSSPKQTKQR